MILSAGNSVVLLGAIFYFYKQVLSMQTEIEKMNNHLTMTIKELDKTKDNSRQLTEVVVRLDKMMKNLPTFDDVDLFGENIEDVMRALKDNGINIDKTPDPPRFQRRRRQVRRTHEQDPDNFDDPNNDITLVRKNRNT